MEKRGSSHIEIVFATLIFIISLTLLLFYLSPIKETPLAKSLIDGASISIEKYVSTDVTKIFVAENKTTGSSSCYSIPLASFNIKGNSSVKDLSNNLIDSYFDGSTIKTDNFEAANIFISEEIDASSPITCTSTKEYQIGSIKKNEKIISYKKLKNMETEYNQKYEELKKNLDIPASIDFKIESPILTMNKIIPEKVEVQAKTIKREMINSSGDITQVELTIKIW